jgi:hypothetical protein
MTLMEACLKLLTHKKQGNLHPVDFQRIEAAIKDCATPRKPAPESETAFDHHRFPVLADDEIYLVYKKSDHFEKAITPPSLAWLDAVFTDAPPGEIVRVERVKILETFEPKT